MSESDTERDRHSGIRDPHGTERVWNAPKHGPITLLRMAWDRYVRSGTEQ